LPPEHLPTPAQSESEPQLESNATPKLSSVSTAAGEHRSPIGGGSIDVTDVTDGAGAD
jgi:hypothetical protein